MHVMMMRGALPGASQPVRDERRGVGRLRVHPRVNRPRVLETLRAKRRSTSAYWYLYQLGFLDVRVCIALDILQEFCSARTKLVQDETPASTHATLITVVVGVMI